MVSPAPTDEALLIAHRAGDSTALSELYARYQDRVMRYAWRMVRRREVAEEVCTEVFVQLMEGAWKPTGSLQGFLFTLTHRRCVDRIRKQERFSRRVLRIPWGMPESTCPEGVAVLSERQRAVETAIGQLSERHRAAVLLYYGQELSSREVADILDCTDQEVRSRLSYARKKLKTLLPEVSA